MKVNENKTINKNEVLAVLNNLDVIEQNGGEDAYIIVANNAETHAKLNAVGVKSDVINKYSDKETFCILALAFSQGYANDFYNGQLVLIPNK